MKSLNKSGRKSGKLQVSLLLSVATAICLQLQNELRQTKARRLSENEKCRFFERQNASIQSETVHIGTRRRKKRPLLLKKLSQQAISLMREKRKSFHLKMKV